MKTGIRKLWALALALVMLLTCSASLAAALNGGIEGDTDDTASVQDNTITIMKELKMYNVDGSSIYMPTVGYTYTISSETVNANTTVTDSGDHVGIVYAGVMAALDGATKNVSFSPSTTTGYKNDGTTGLQTITQPTAAATAGTSYYGGFSITVNPAEFEHAGIYRYKIVEAEDATNTLVKAGVTHQDAAYNNTRYLDVYVRRAVAPDGVTTDYVVYGYVMWVPAAGENQNTSITKQPNVTKTNGYVAAAGGDEYNTYNLIVTKEIEGALAEPNHQFPFEVKFTSPNATAAQIHYSATNGIPTARTTASLSSAAVTTIGSLTSASALKLTDGGSVKFVGIPAGVTATVQENNDTYDVYTASASIVANTAQTYEANQVQAGNSATIISGLDNATTVSAVGNKNTEANWTNTIDIVSPTGYVARFAPYALILVAGLAMLFIAMKSRKAKTEE